MGTFHEGKGELHGITVVVALKDARVLVGRCDTVTDEGVFLMDADMHDENEADANGNKVSTADYLQRAAKFGVWKKMDKIVVPAADVESVRPLAELA